MTARTFVLIDETGGLSTANGETLTATKLSAIASACQTYLNRDVASEHGGGPCLVRVSSGADLQSGEIVFAILPALPNAPGAVAYHSVDGAGLAVAYDAIAASDSLTGPGNSLSVAISHELAEIVGDEGCNLWADDGTGTEHAHELCDPVEVQSYEVTPGSGIYVSNFVLRSYFDPSHAGPFDWMTLVGLVGAVAPSGPLQTAIGAGGNYQITRKADPSTETQVTALFPFGYRRPWRHGSRRAKRGVVP